MEQATVDPRVKDALELLNNVAKDKKDEVQKMVSEKYSNLADTLSEGSKSVMQRRPLFFLGGIAAGFLAAGYFLGMIMKRGSRGFFRR